MPARLAVATVRRDLDATAKRALARRLPWPYNGMISDITSAIQTNCNYLAAAALVLYTEICGRQVDFAGRRNASNFDCFAAFLRRMGADQALNQPVLFQGKREKFHDVVRNGLVHEYFMKADGGGVALTTSDPDGRKTGFFQKKPGELWFAVTPFFSLFSKTLDDLHAAGQLLAWRR